MGFELEMTVSKFRPFPDSQAVSQSLPPRFDVPWTTNRYGGGDEATAIAMILN